MAARIHDSVRIGRREACNRLYRAPLLEVAGNKPNAAAILARELGPSAEGGCGLVFQGASLVTPDGGRTAPGLSRVHDRDFVLSLKPAVDRVHAAGSLLFMQVGHGALQTMETWHAEYRVSHPGLTTWAVSPPPSWFGAMMRAGFLHPERVRVFSTQDLEELARAFGRAAQFAFEAGYDGMHLAGANASIFQQLWSPIFNKRTDRFGGPTLRERGEFFRLVVSEMRRATRADFPITAKVPAETSAPWFIRGALSIADGVEIAAIARDAGIDGIAPVQVGLLRDQTVARGKFPRIAWDDPRFQEGYQHAFGSRSKVRLIRTANAAAARIYPFEPMWNVGFCAKVKRRVPDAIVFAEGGIRERAQMDRILADGAADMVGMARPFYAEPLLARRILRDEPSGAVAACESCNNCTIPQVAGMPGVCRTPAILARRGAWEKAGVYDPSTPPP
ncbi:MAG: oxidoreductase [Thermoplasmatota archaeon]